MARPAKYLDPEEITTRHLDGESVHALARSLGVHDERIKEVLEAQDVEIVKNLWGEHHPRWTGGRSVSHYGYVRLTLPRDDPMREMVDGRGMVFEHRLVMARHLNRPLRADETVHHIDGDRQNNNLSNLQLRVGAHGVGVKAMCGDCGSTNVLVEEI
jgi:hypothetical protein